MVQLFLLLLCGMLSSQRLFSDSVDFRGVTSVLADDYGNIYVYRAKDFSFTKINPVGKQEGKVMFTLPVSVQSVQNPLSIPVFSENAQEIRFYDQYLNLVQTKNFRQFGWIKNVYADGKNFIWLLEEGSRRLICYDATQDRVLSAANFDIRYDEVVDFAVSDSRIFVLTKGNFSIYKLNGEKVYDLKIKDGQRLRMENGTAFLISANTVWKSDEKGLEKVFHSAEADFVDKNSSSYFELKGDKLYLYQP